MFGCSNSKYRFNCSRYKHCYENKTHSVSNSYPFFELTGYHITTEIFVENMFHKPRMRGILGKKCDGNPPHFQIGSIGLGVDGPAFSSLPNGPAFSFYVKSENNSLSAVLYFQKEATMIDVTGESYRVSANNDWHMTIEKFRIDKLVLNVETYAILEPNFRYIGIPEGLFNQILEYIIENYNLNCIKVLDHYNCLYAKDIYSLPTLELFMDRQYLQVTPDMYLEQKGGLNNYTLLIVPTTTDITSDDTYVTSAYADFTILGLPFITDKYLYFSLDEDQSPHIEIYRVREELGDLVFKRFLIIFLIIIAVTLLFGCLISLIKTTRDKAKREEELLDRIEGSYTKHTIHSVYSPLIHSRFRDQRK